MAYVKETTSGDKYLKKHTTEADKGAGTALQSYEKQLGSDGASSNTVYTLASPYVPDSYTLVIFVNGQKAEKVSSASDTTEYEETNDSQVTFGGSLLDGDVIEFIVFGAYLLDDIDLSVYSLVDGSRNFTGNVTFEAGIEASGGSLSLASGTGINEFSIDGNLAGNSDDAVPTEKAVKTYVDTAGITSYDTGWINRSDWTDVHLGSNTSKDVDSNVAHNLGAPLSDLLVKFLISPTGNDSDSFEVYANISWSGSQQWGWTIFQVDANTVQVQTGNAGINYLDTAGTGHVVNTDDWYYKIKVLRLV
jgi:hypothetical protein